MFRNREQAPRHESHPDDITVYEPLKKLGNFVVQVVPPHSETSDYYQRSGIIEDAGQSFIDIHLDPNADPADLGPHTAAESLGMLADYLAAHKDEISAQEIVGLTYPRLGKVATYFGFSAEPVDNGKIPMNLRNIVREKDTSSEKYDPNYQLVALKQGTDELIDRFGGGNTDRHPSKAKVGQP